MEDIVEELRNKTGNIVIVKSQQCPEQMPKTGKAFKEIVNDVLLRKIRSKSV